MYDEVYDDEDNDGEDVIKLAIEVDKFFGGSEQGILFLIRKDQSFDRCLRMDMLQRILKSTMHDILGIRVYMIS
jgi:hypothetical protein